METLSSAYHHLQYARVKDRYHHSINTEEFINTYFPESLPAFVQDMSDLTAAFFGTMLAKARIFWGASGVDALAMATITDMGRFKAKQALARYPGLPKDGRGLLLVLISGIFSASPEYQFSITEFSAELVKATFTGNDRYYRVAAAKGVENLVTWPTLLHFLRGANAELGWHYDIDLDIKQLDADGTCHYEVVIKPQTAGKQQAVLLPDFLKMPESDMVKSFGLLAYVPLGSTGQYAGAGFYDLLKKAIALEAGNYMRLKGDHELWYMLAENISAAQCGELKTGKDCYAVIKNRTQTGKKTHVTIGILDQDHEAIYDFTLDYYLWERSVFEDKFSMLQSAAGKYSDNGSTDLPRLKDIQYTNDLFSRAVLPAFTETQCAGHYPGFPCVPAVAIYQLLMTGNLKWIAAHKAADVTGYTPGFMELLPVKMIPVGMELTVETRITPLSKKRFRFAHTILNAADGEVHLLVTADITIR